MEYPNISRKYLDWLVNIEEEGENKREKNMIQGSLDEEVCQCSEALGTAATLHSLIM